MITTWARRWTSILKQARVGAGPAQERQLLSTSFMPCHASLTKKKVKPPFWICFPSARSSCTRPTWPGLLKHLPPVAELASGDFSTHVPPNLVPLTMLSPNKVQHPHILHALSQLLNSHRLRGYSRAIKWIRSCSSGFSAPGVHRGDSSSTSAPQDS